MEYINCVLCDSSSYTLFRQAKDPDQRADRFFNAVRCNNCGLIYLNPRPAPQEISTFYFQEYYGNPGKGVKSGFRLMTKIFQWIRRRKIEQYKKGGKILDVGYGDGTFLKEMHDNDWQVYGVEISKSAIQFDGRSENLNIFYGNLQNAHFLNSSFDVITMWQVLEHVFDPALLLKELNRILKDDGLLFISVPNIESIQSKVSGNRWFHLDLPRHLYHYSPETLTAMVRRAGFTLHKISQLSLEYNCAGLLQSILNLTGCQFNFLYNFLKRGQINKKGMHLLKFAYTILTTTIFTPILLPLVIVFSYICSITGYGGAIELYGYKAKEDQGVEKSFTD